MHNIVMIKETRTRFVITLQDFILWTIRLETNLRLMYQKVKFRSTNKNYQLDKLNRQHKQASNIPYKNINIVFKSIRLGYINLYS